MHVAQVAPAQVGRGSPGSTDQYDANGSYMRLSSVASFLSRRALLQDRFAVPKASLTCSTLGAPVYGLAERPSLRVTKHDFERLKALENDRQQIR